MYSAEEIRNIGFSHLMGGYKASEVDEFVDACADTVEELTRRNLELTKKLEVLAERLMEYRKDEDNIHTALLSAQRAGDALLREAQHKATLLLEDAAIKAEKAKELAERDIQEERAELRRVQEEVTEFKKALLEMYRQHLTLIDALPEAEAVEEEVPVEEAAEPAEAAAEAVTVVPVAEEEEEEPIEDVYSSSEAAATAEEGAEEPAAAPAEEPQGEPSLFTAAAPAEQPTSRFSDLQFGPEYEIEGETRRRFGKRKQS